MRSQSTDTFHDHDAGLHHVVLRLEALPFPGKWWASSRNSLCSAESPGNTRALELFPSLGAVHLFETPIKYFRSS